ncbi:MAG: hypothetical protein KME16_06310 [Scytolyngbya sp. HA4215-MV1]|jgi:hypothetical protein|nr:hypothetical protein [Scytolyngbya sp. HA4215-MV1]
MLPTLSEYGIETPAYIRKIDSLARWNPEGCSTLEERAKIIAEKLFREPHNLYSIWLVNTDREFYSIVASLSEYRSPKNQNIDFIWLTEKDFQEIGIHPENQPEGGCLHAQYFHFNITIEPYSAEKLCDYLLRQGREAKRCQKAKTAQILAYQKQIGCKATDNNLIRCECEQ